MKWLKDFLLGGPVKPEWKFIGYVSIPMVNHKGSPNQQKFVATINYYMTEEGERKIELNDRGVGGVELWIKQYSDDYAAATLWVEGGAFPKHFKPVGEVLKDMLIRLIDKELVGEEK